MRFRENHITILVAGIVVLGVTAVGSAVVARHDIADTDLIALGSQFPAAGRVLPDGGGTLIAPTWVLTAAHVARSLQPLKGRIVFNGREYPVKNVVIHKEGSASGRRPPRVDLALVELQEPVNGIDPARLYRDRDEKGKTAYIVGFGDTGNGTIRPRRSDGKCRAVTNIIQDADPERIFFLFEKPPGGTRLEGVGGPGDSGGPAMIKMNDKLFVVGVSHASMGGKPGRYGVTDIYMRVSSFVEWIDEVVGTSIRKD